MTKAEILMEYRACVMELQALEQQYEKLLFLGEPRTGGGGLRNDADSRRTNEPMHAKLQTQDGVLAHLYQARARLEKAVMAFEEVLGGVRDVKLRAILRYYYGLGYSDSRIAELMDCSDRTVSNRRRGFLMSA